MVVVVYNVKLFRYLVSACRIRSGNVIRSQSALARNAFEFDFDVPQENNNFDAL